jgi:hypothetical protein
MEGVNLEENMSDFRYPKRKCDECGTEYAPRRSDSKFCSLGCARKYAKKNKIGFWSKHENN